jgi:hypothetical protein
MLSIRLELARLEGYLRQHGRRIGPVTRTKTRSLLHSPPPRPHVPSRPSPATRTQLAAAVAVMESAALVGLLPADGQVCCKKQKGLLKGGTGLATSSDRPCYKWQSTYVQVVAGLATSGGRICYMGQPALLMELAACYHDTSELLPADAGVATKGCQSCYKGLTTVLPWRRHYC